MPQSPEQAAAAAWQLGLPLVAKWSRPWLILARRGLRSTVVVRSTWEARALYLRTAEAGSPLLFQAYLPPGPDRDWFFHGYVDRAGVTHGGAGRKHHAWPRGAGLTMVAAGPPIPGAQFRLFEDASGLDVVRALHLDLTHPSPARPGTCAGACVRGG